MMLWSYPDLMGLRMIYWLRQTKELGDGKTVPASSMPAVRRALGQLRELDLALWTGNDGFSVSVDREIDDRMPDLDDWEILLRTAATRSLGMRCGRSPSTAVSSSTRSGRKLAFRKRTSVETLLAAEDRETGCW